MPTISQNLTVAALPGITQSAVRPVGIEADEALTVAGIPSISGAAVASARNEADGALTAASLPTVTASAVKKSLFTDLLLCYPLNSSAIDAQGGHDGVATDVTYVAGKVGNAADFNGTSGEIIAGNIDALDDLATFTISFWVYIDSHPTSGLRHIVRYSRTDANWFSVFLSDDSMNFFSTVGGTTSAKYYALTNFPVGAWLHVLAVYPVNIDGHLQTAVYVNNVSKNSIIGGVSGVPYTVPGLTIGSSGGDHFFDGKIDELCLWTRTVTAIERGLIYNSGNGIAWPLGGIALPAMFMTTDTITGDGYSNVMSIGSWATAGSITGMPVDEVVDDIYVHDFYYYAYRLMGNPPCEKDFLTTPSNLFDVDKNGNYFSFDYSYNLINAYTPAHAVKWQYYLENGSVQNIACDSGGEYLYFTNKYSGQQIGKLSIATGAEAITGGWPVIDITTGTLGKIKFGPDGYIYALAGGDTLYKIDPADGSTKWSYTVSNGINSLAINTSGEVALGCCVFGLTGDTLRKLTSAGTLAWAAAPKGDGMPMGDVAIDAAGNVYFYTSESSTTTDDGFGRYASDGSGINWFINRNASTGEAYGITWLGWSAADPAYIYAISRQAGIPGGLWKHRASDGVSVWLYPQPADDNYHFFKAVVMPTPLRAWKIYLTAGANGGIYKSAGMNMGGMVAVADGEDIELHVTGTGIYGPASILVDGVEQII